MPLDPTAEALARLLEQFKQLKQSYERYWQGLERPEPERERLAMRAAFAQLRATSDSLTQVAQAFRLRTAQQSFLAFDQLCERRAKAQLEGPRHRLHGAARVAAPAAAAPRTAAPASGQIDALYRQLVAHLSAQGLPAPSAEKFLRQVQACLAAAQAQAPGQSLRAQLRFDGEQRAQLVVVPKP